MRSFFALIVVAACLTGCQSDDTPETPSATVATAPATTATTATTATSVAPTPEEEVEAAYLKSWEIYADALLRLDGSRFPEVYVDDALVMRNEELAELVLANMPARMVVDHDYVIVVTSEGEQAVVTDSYLNHSVLLDGNTGQPMEADPNNRLSRKYDMRKEGSVWYVERVTGLP